MTEHAAILPQLILLLEDEKAFKDLLQQHVLVVSKLVAKELVTDLDELFNVIRDNQKPLINRVKVSVVKNYDQTL